MSGPKSPQGYDPIFHDLLAQAYMKPAEIEIESERNPKHLRSLFNQFRASWDRQAQIHRKRKEIQQETICRNNYNILMQYECKLTQGGILLRARGTDQAKLIVRGTAPQAQLSIDDLLGPASAPVAELSYVPPSENELRAILGAKPASHSGQIMQDNLPQNSSSLITSTAQPKGESGIDKS